MECDEDILFTKLRNWMSNIWNSIKDNTVGIAGRLWDKVRNIFGNMRDGLKSIIGKIKRSYRRYGRCY